MRETPGGAPARDHDEVQYARCVAKPWRPTPSRRGTPPACSATGRPDTAANLQQRLRHRADGRASVRKDLLRVKTSSAGRPRESSIPVAGAGRVLTDPLPDRARPDGAPQCCRRRRAGSSQRCPPRVPWHASADCRRLDHDGTSLTDSTPGNAGLRDLDTYRSSPHSGLRHPTCIGCQSLMHVKAGRWPGRDVRDDGAPSSAFSGALPRVPRLFTHSHPPRAGLLVRTPARPTRRPSRVEEAQIRLCPDPPL